MAETNGRYDLVVGTGENARTYPLLFGMAAVREMARRTMDGFTANEIKLVTDLIYSGSLNYAISQDLPFPTYGEIYSLVEEFQEQEDATQQFDRMWEVFNTSKFGAKWIETVEEAKKKAMELLAEGLPNGIGKS